MDALINGVNVPNSLLGELKDTNLKNATDEKLRKSLKIVLKPQIFWYFGVVEIPGPQEYSTEYSIGIL